MPFGITAGEVVAGAAVVGAGAQAYGASKSGGGGGQGPSEAGWIANAQGLTDLEGENNPLLSPYNAFGSQWAGSTDQAQGLQSTASSMANQFNSGAQALTNQQNDLSGQVSAAAQNYLNGGQQAQYLANMNALTPAYYGAGSNAFGMGQQLQGQAGQAQAYGNTIMNMALDPQSALFNQMNQQQQQQALASQAARGISTSGVGAGLSSQADQNFLINWQNQQLSRAAQGLSAYDANNQSIAGLVQGANQSYTTGLQDYTTGAGLNYNAANTVYGNNQTAYNNQQAALQAQQAAYLQQMQIAQQGFSNQANALTGYQTALADQQNNLVAGNAWLNQNASNFMNYYNNSAPTWNNGQAAAAANGYAGLGNFIGSGTGSNAVNTLMGNGQNGISGLYNSSVINNAANNGDSTDYLAAQMNPYANASAWGNVAADSAAAGGAGDLAGFAALGG